MKKTLILSAMAILLAALSIFYFVFYQPSRTAQKVSAEDENNIQNEAGKSLIVAPGVVEAISEETEVGAEIPGKLQQVLVEEGDRVIKGQTIAVLENSDYQSRIAEARTKIEILLRRKQTAEAGLAQAKADRARIYNGARPEERAEAIKNVEQLQPEIAQAKNELERRRRLYDSGDVSREDLERAQRNFDSLVKQGETLRAKFTIVNAAARADDLEKADTAIQLAQSQITEFDALLSEAQINVRTAEADLKKTIVRSPMTGIVLRKRLKDGESVSPENQTGIVTVADVSALRVRIDLDETDVAKVRENQNAFVKADAYGEQQFSGKVVKIGQILGRKNFRTDRPTEKVDTKILEVLIELAPGQKLPLGLRVDAFIQP